MRIADTSEVKLLYIKETTWGVFDSTGTGETARITSESLAIERGTTTTEEIRSDRQITDVVPTTYGASGDIAGELSYRTYDAFIEGGMFNDFRNTTNSVAIDIDAVHADGTITIASGYESEVANMNGQPFYIGGFSDASNNGRYVGVSYDDVTRVLTTVPGFPVADATPSGISYFSDSVINDSNDVTFTMERQLIRSGSYNLYTGMYVNNMAFNIEAESLATATFSFIGESGDSSGTTQMPGTINPATTTTLLSSGTQDGKAYIDGVESGLIRSISLTVENNLRAQTAIGKTGASGIGLGNFSVTGSLSLYFQNRDLYEKYLDNEAISLIFTLGSDVPGEGVYTFYIPNLKFTNASAPATGANSDILISGEYQALLSPEHGSTMVIGRLPNTVPPTI